MLFHLMSFSSNLEEKEIVVTLSETLLEALVSLYNNLLKMEVSKNPFTMLSEEEMQLK